MQRSSSFALAATLACGFLLAVVDDASAQRRGRGYRGGYSGGYYGGGYYGGGYYGGGRYYSDSYYGPGVYLGGSRTGVYLGFGGSPGYYSRSYPSGTYYSEPYYSGPYYSGRYYSEAPPRMSGDYEEAEPVRRVPSDDADETRLRVILPDEQGTVWLDGQRMSTTGTSRLYGFPYERSGQTYRHRVRATWMEGDKPVTREREVEAAGGKTTVVDFTREDDRDKE